MGTTNGNRIKIGFDALKAVAAEYNAVLKDFVAENSQEELLLVHARAMKAKFIKMLADEKAQYSFVLDPAAARAFVQFWTECGIAFYDDKIAGIHILLIVGRLDQKVIKVNQLKRI